MKTIIQILIPAIVSIIGFGLTYYKMKKTFQHELSQQKANLQLDKMSTMPYEILVFMQEMISGNKQDKTNKNMIDKLNKLYSTIYAYGSVDAIRILATMQNENYIYKDNLNKNNGYRTMAFYVLLASQIRFDITNEIISPSYWFKIKLTDYNEFKDLIISENNKIVDELNLNEDFKS